MTRLASVKFRPLPFSRSTIIISTAAALFQEIAMFREMSVFVSKASLLTHQSPGSLRRLRNENTGIPLASQNRRPLDPNQAAVAEMR